MRCKVGATHEEIAAELGCSRQSVQLIEERAMLKLRLALGSSYRGPVAPFLFDFCGVPEPVGEESRNESRRKVAASQKRTRGRFGSNI